jgi:hypothetical protein
MEISVGNFGKYMFESMTTDGKLSEHWESIAKEARPLVMKLIALNDKMVKDGKPSGYEIYGYKPTPKSKKKLSKTKRISLAQECWKVRADALNEGDKFWTTGCSDIEMYVTQDDPVSIMDITKTKVYFEMSHCGGSHTECIELSEMVLKAPDDFDEKKAIYQSEEFWLKKADELGI